MIVTFQEWQLEVDIEVTKRAYEATQFGLAEGCGCVYCENCILQRETVYPPSVKELFTKLSIDFRKEAEIYECYELANNANLYAGWLHFSGKLLRGKDCKIPLESGGYTLDLTPITGDFKVGFKEGDHLSFFPNGTPLVQIEFEVKLPWLLN